MRHYCSYFDRHYLPRALALYQSLCSHADEFYLHALCLDVQSYDVLKALALPRIRIIHLDHFLAHDSALRRVRDTRPALDFYFTCTASLPIFVLASDASIDAICYLDADLFFFSSPEPIFSELGDAPVMAIEHRFPNPKDILTLGRFNVAMQNFRRGAVADACLQRWREQCLNWCHARVEDGLFGDQKYLDEWPQLYPAMCVVQHPGADLAPWNLASHQLSLPARPQRGVLVDGKPLIFFHFHRTRRVVAKLYDPTLAEFKVKSSPLIRAIFRPYARALEQAEASVRSLLPEVNLNLSQRERLPAKTWRAHFSGARAFVRKLLAGHYIWL